MARWRLAAPHYLKVPGTEWEYKEVDRTTGRQKAVKFPVPLHLDPDQPADWNYRYEGGAGEIIVCHEGKGEPKDVIFLGDPTPDMVPLDEEAKTLTTAMAPKWNRPYEPLEGGSYAEGILDDLTKQIRDLRDTQPAPKIEGMQELLTAMATMMKQNQELLARLAPAPAEEPKAAAGGRRI